MSKEVRVKRFMKLFAMLKKDKIKAFLKDIDDDEALAVGEIVNNLFQNKIPGVNLKKIEKHYKILRNIYKNKKNSKILKLLCAKHSITLEKVLLYLKTRLLSKPKQIEIKNKQVEIKKPKQNKPLEIKKGKDIKVVAENIDDINEIGS